MIGGLAAGQEWLHIDHPNQDVVAAMSAGRSASQGNLVLSHRKSPRLATQIGRTHIAITAARTHHCPCGDVTVASIPISVTMDDAAQLAPTQTANRSEKIQVPHRCTLGFKSDLSPFSRSF
jgi:hypothetical protein